jgi:protein-tyrosine phosphatase
MEKTVMRKFKMWQRSSWPYWLYAKTVFALQPYRDDTFEATQIVPNLWVGDRRSPCNEESLKANNIDMIVSAVYGATAYHPFEFKYEKADLRDVASENILSEIDRLLPEIRQQVKSNHGVLIHCMEGKSRSVTIAAAYLIKYHHMSDKEALKYMKEKRSCVNPNQGYLDQLRSYYETLQAQKEEVEIEKKDK